MSFAQSLEAAFGVIGAASIVSNAMFCFLLYKRPFFLKKPHNILLLTLATMDMMTGVLIFATPRFQITKDPLLVKTAGHFFCHLFYNSFLVFFVSKASILTVTLLALERWCSVIKPFKYKVFFAKRRLLIYISCIVLLSASMQSYKFLDTEFKNSTCIRVPSHFGHEGRQAFVLCYVTATFGFPTLVIWASFIHVWYRIKKSPSVSVGTEQAQSQQKLLLRMCAITAAVLTGCWLPSQIFYVVTHFVVSQYASVGSHLSLVLAMSNSIMNPWIYFLSNKEYRKEFYSLNFTCKRNAPVSPESAGPEIVTRSEHTLWKKEVNYEL